MTVTGSGNTWTHTFSDLPVYDAAGAEYTYRARELGVGSGPLRNYSSAVDADPLTGAITVTNTLETIRIPVEKRWEGDAGRSEYLLR